MATGLWFLTRIRGEDDVTTVSAVRDPFAEVTVLTLPEGAVRPPSARARRGRTPIRQPLRIETRWRIRSLAAWLTMQLRYVVFHGPCAAGVEGRARCARGAGRAGTNFRAGSARRFLDRFRRFRSRPLLAIFLGRTQLLKDRVADGVGVLIVEEAPMAGRRPGRVRMRADRRRHESVRDVSIATRAAFGARACNWTVEDGAQGRNRTTDTVIFSHVLYQLSYLGIPAADGSQRL